MDWSRYAENSQSPIFASFSETLAGVVTIRAYRQQRRFTGANEVRVDRNQEAYYVSDECTFPWQSMTHPQASVNCNRWLAVRLELISAFIILCAAVLAVFSLVTLKRLDAGCVFCLCLRSRSRTVAQACRSDDVLRLKHDSIAQLDRSVGYRGAPLSGLL